jgi:peptidoglycan/xylan/chitin deacetylase (PgdA/CDA1 family)
MSPAVRARLRRWIGAGLHFSGMLQLLAAVRLRRKAVVLMYHRVLSKEDQGRSFSGAGMFVTPETFERHVRYLRRRFNPLTVGEFAEIVEEGRPFPPRACLVTFDDGWRDNLQQALPILERHRVPAAIFITSGVTGHTGGFWQECLLGLLYHAWQARVLDESLRKDLGADIAGLDAADPETARAMLREVVTRLKQRSRRDTETLMQRVAGALDSRGLAEPHSGMDRLMSWEEVRKLSESEVVTIGSHCVSHIPLTQLPAEAVRDELRKSRGDIEARVGVPVFALAFPNGDHDETACNEARACGYRLAFTTRSGAVSPGDDPFRLRRVSIHEGAAPTVSVLLSRLVGVL